MKAYDDTRLQAQLVSALQACWEGAGEQVLRFETHISVVLVTQTWAYKFKKPVRLDFLDFSTLALRRHYCQEELRLNRRLAPGLYDSVMAVTGTSTAPELDETGPAIEYAVRMKRFEQSALWSERLATQFLSATEVEALAVLLAGFHSSAAPMPMNTPWGMPERIRAVAEANIAELDILLDGDGRRSLQVLRDWNERECERQDSTLVHRRQGGHIRECHGDLHAANILTRDGRVEAFDCIEFSEGLRCIDVMNDLAFIVMDLRFRGHPGFAASLLNRYLELTGDYEGLALLSFYAVHRALVRAKVSLLRDRRLEAPGGPTDSEGMAYLAFAEASLRPPRQFLAIMHGVSGCGKSRLARELVPLASAVQLRSDVERKRMRGMPVLRGAEEATPPIYDAVTTQKTYSRLRELSRCVLAAGLPVIVDATFLQRDERVVFRQLAHEIGVPFVIFDMSADKQLMLERIVQRKAARNNPSDADAAVLERQLMLREPLAADEDMLALRIDTGSEPLEKCVARASAMLEQIGGKHEDLYASAPGPTLMPFHDHRT